MNWLGSMCHPNSLNDLINVIRPTLERGARFVGVFGAIVRACYSLLMAALVIENSFDVPGLYAEFGHASCSGPAQVMQAPRRNVQALI